MWAFVVEASPEAIEFLLLAAVGPRRGSSRLAFEIAMHALVLPVFLGTRRVNTLMDDPELHPPDAERGQPPNRTGNEGRPVVGADGRGQADGPKQRAKGQERVFAGCGGQRATGEQLATVVIGHREWVAIRAGL